MLRNNFGFTRGIFIVSLSLLGISHSLATPASSMPQRLVEDPVSAEWAEKWREDIAFVAEQMPNKHYDLFHTMSRDDFDQAIASLTSNVTTYSHHDIIVELARIVARVSDGHTRLTLPLAPGIDFFQGHTKTPPPALEEMLFHQYPIRLYRFEDGLFVTSIDARYKALAGARVLEIGTLPAMEAYDRVADIVHRDNDMQLRSLVPTRLVLAEVLDSLQIVEDVQRATFLLEMPTGEQRSIDLAPVVAGAAIEWYDAREGASYPIPLYLSRPNENFWFTSLDEGKTIYLQFNEVADSPGESFDAFCRRLFSHIEEGPAERLIIDIRGNRGGDNYLNFSLLHGLIASDKLRQHGSVFTIIGRDTFSAAMTLTIELQKNNLTIFVGEPTGSSPIHYGDSRKIKLPHSGVTIRVSTLYWQPTRSDDSREWIAPNLPTPLRSSDYLANRDPAVEAILELNRERPEPGTFTGRWSGEFSAGSAIQPFAVIFQREDDAWSVMFVVGEDGRMPLNDVRVEAEHCHFELPTGDLILAFDGTWYGDVIIGTMTGYGPPAPFVLRRDRDKE